MQYSEFRLFVFMYVSHWLHDYESLVWFWNSWFSRLNSVRSSIWNV